MLDVVITKNWFSDRKSRSVNNSLQRPDLGLLVGLEASRPTYWGVWGAEPPRKKGSYILHVSVVPLFVCVMYIALPFSTAAALTVGRTFLGDESLAEKLWCC